MTHRKFLQIAPAIASTPLLLGAEGNKFAPIRQITRGPEFHWFAYYDKLHFSPDNRFVLCNRSTFENWSPEREDVIKVGTIDLQDGGRFMSREERKYRK